MSAALFRVYEPAECGADGYPFAWHETIKHQVRDEAGHRCLRCGHPYAKGAGEWSPCDDCCRHPLFDIEAQVADEEGARSAHWRILTVHHLDGDKRNCRWWNLAALCQRCHLRIQRVVVLGRVYPWEHSEWFKPFAAGWYAHAYLGESITREEADARLEELLALERAA